MVSYHLVAVTTGGFEMRVGKSWSHEVPMLSHHLQRIVNYVKPDQKILDFLKTHGGGHIECHRILMGSCRSHLIVRGREIYGK